MIIPRNSGEFQSFLFWMLIRKSCHVEKHILPRWCFNPSYSGCWFGSLIKVIREQAYSLQFQSFLFWMLIRKLLANFQVHCVLFGFQSFLFWMLIRKRLYHRAIVRRIRVSILLILDVDSEGPGQEARWPVKRCFNPSYSGCWFGSKGLLCRHFSRPKFQSFLFWMLIRKHSMHLRWNTHLSGFNPSYSGCWFGRR